MVSDKMNAQKLAYEYIRERMLDGTYKGGMRPGSEKNVLRVRSVLVVHQFAKQLKD